MNNDISSFQKNWGGPKGPPQVPKLVKEGDLACLPKHAYHIYRSFFKKTLVKFFSDANKLFKYAAVK